MDNAILVRRIEARLARLLAPPRIALVPLLADGEIVGHLTTERAQRLARFPAVARHGEVLVVACERSERNAAMAGIARVLAHEGALTAWRDELYAVRNAFDAPSHFEIERAAARYLGIRTYAAHVNGLTRAQNGIGMWLARRSANKAIDPGMLDNLVGGGIAAAATVEGTVVKESWEEAGIEADVAVRAVLASELTIFRHQPDGIQNETIYAHDLWLPPAWSPANQDGEALEHRLIALAETAAIVADDHMTADASLVALDCLVRLGALADSASFRALRHAAVPP